MQRYRVNYPLLIGLVVGTLVIGVGSFFLWRFQLERNAGRLLARAEEARAEGELGRAAGFIAQYTRLRPNDEEALANLATTLADLAESAQAQPKEIGSAIGFLEAAVREQPDNEELRRRLVDLYMSPKVRVYKASLDHIGQLLNRNPGDRELELMRSTCLFGTASPEAVKHAYTLIGYDEATETYSDNGIANDETSLYLRIAQKLRNEKQDAEAADKLMQRMVEVNPESGQAWLVLGQYQETAGRDDDARESVERALQLDPEDANIVVANARLLIREGENQEFGRARDLLLESLKNQPDVALLYQTLAEIEIRTDQHEKALEWYQKGIKNTPVAQAQTLYFYQARLQIERGDYEAAQETIKAMREAEQANPAFVDYLGARLAMSENRWFDAAKELDRLQNFLVGVPGINVELHIMRAFCYEKLGQDEKALEAYSSALELDFRNKVAMFGKARIQNRLGIGTERESNPNNIYYAMAKELAKPKEEQDWESFDKMVDIYIDRAELSEAMRAVMKGEVLMRRGLYDQARAKLVESYRLEPNNLGVRRAAVKLFASDPSQGPEKALKLLDKVVKDFGDMPILRLERGDLLIALTPDDLTEQLFALADDIDDWEARQKIQLWSGLATRFEQLRDAESRQECLAMVAELSPSDLETLLRLFMMAREGNDPERMRSVQDRILKVVGSKEDSTWLFAEAHRLISDYREQRLQGEGLEEAAELVKRALVQRPEWSRLHHLQAEIELLRNNEAAALKSFDMAAKFGRPTALSLFQHVKLLIRQNRHADALREMERVTPDIRQRLLGRDYAVSLLRTGKTTDAIVEAEKTVEYDAGNSATQLWYGRFLSSAQRSAGLDEQYVDKLRDQAGEAFERAVEINPKSSEAWLALVSHYVTVRKMIDAEDVIRRAQVELDEDQFQLLFARCYELIGRAIDAESLYKQALAQVGPKDKVRVSRLLAQFYLGPIYRTQDKVQKATPLINDVLREVAEGRAEPTDANVRWVRRAAARLLASGGQYQQLRDAENLLTSNAVDGQLLTSDKLLMAEILAPRPEYVSRFKAARLLEQLGENQDLSLKSEIALAKLYFDLDEWRNCRERIVSAIARNPDNPQLRLVYLEMLLERGQSKDIATAKNQLRQLVKQSPNSLAVREVAARIAHKLGRKQEATEAITGVLPRKAASMTAEQLPVIRKVADLLTEFEDYKNAQSYYQIGAELGGAADKVRLLEFTGKHVDSEAAFDRLAGLRSELRPLPVIQGGLNILRSDEEQESDAFEKHAAMVQEWLDRALREDPDNLSLKLQQSDLYDIRQDYAKAVEVYRDLLDQPELRGGRRAVVLNNVAYLLALIDPEDKASISEGVRYIDEAVALLGPQTDILDTRAMIAIADGRYGDAIEDIDRSLIDKKTDVRYFHKSLAHMLNDEIEDALSAWQEAVKRGLTIDSISTLEKNRYDQVKRRLEGGGLSDARL